jgi:hypothetical protein
MQRSYSAEKSAAVTADSGLEQAGSSPCAHTLPLTTLAHVGEHRETGARRRVSQLAPSRPGWLTYIPKGGGGEVAGGVVG